MTDQNATLNQTLEALDAAPLMEQFSELRNQFVNFEMQYAESVGAGNDSDVSPGHVLATWVMAADVGDTRRFRQAVALVMSGRLLHTAP